MDLASRLNLPYLAKLVRGKRGQRGLRETAQDVGDVSPSTLSRIEGERLNDMTLSTFLRICDWLEVNPADLLMGPERTKATQLAEGDAIELQVRQAKELRPQTANILAATIRAAYREDRRQREEADS